MKLKPIRLRQCFVEPPNPWVYDYDTDNDHGPDFFDHDCENREAAPCAA